MIKDLSDWKKQVKEYNIKLNDILNKNSTHKNLYFGFEVFDGKPINNPDILFIGINPGRGNGQFSRDTFETKQISYLDIYNEDYRNDYPNTYHLAEKTIKFFKLVGWDETKIKSVFRKRVVKTNFFHLATENIADLKKIIIDIDYSDKYFKKSAEFSIQLINILKPKIVILEGKSVFNNIIKQCYEKDVWNNDDFGYFFDKENNTHIIGYSRGRNFSNEKRFHFINKLKEILA
jgi:hypothetical protein